MWWFDDRRAGLPLVLGVLLPGLVAAGCSGYRWLGPAGTGLSPAERTGLRVTVGAFHNETLEPFLAEKVSASLRERLLAAGVVVEPSGSPRLSGRIDAFSDEVIAFDAAGIPTHRRVVMRVQVSLEGDGKPLWPERAVTGSAEYPVTPDSTLNRDLKDRAVDEAVLGVAETLLLDLIALEDG